MVHVEVDQGHALDPVHVQCMAYAHGHVVEKTKAHAGGALGMVAGRAHVAKGGAHLALQHQVGGQHGGAGRAQGRLHGVGVHHRVGVEPGITFCGDAVQQLTHIAGRMRTAQLLLAGQGSVVGHHEVAVAPRQQHVANGVQALGAFRVVGAHFVFQTVGMGDVGGQHGVLSR